jgi:pilus assembly protein CpaC
MTASLCAASFLSGELLFGQQKTELSRPSLQPLQRVAIEAVPAAAATTNHPQNQAASSPLPQVRPALLSVKPGDDNRVSLASAEEELPPILSGANAPQRPSKRGPAKEPAKQPEVRGQGPGVVESSRRVAPAGGQRTEVGGQKSEVVKTEAAKPESAAIPAGAPSSSSPWMQDIRQLVNTTPGAKKFTSPPSVAPTVAPAALPTAAPTAAAPTAVLAAPRAMAPSSFSASPVAAAPAVAVQAPAVSAPADPAVPESRSSESPLLKASRASAVQPFAPAPLAIQPASSTSELPLAPAAEFVAPAAEPVAEPLAPIATAATLPPPSKRFPLAPTRNVPAAGSSELQPRFQQPSFTQPIPGPAAPTDDVASQTDEPALAPIMNRPQPARESMQREAVQRPSMQAVNFNQPPAPRPLNLAPMADPMPAAPDAMQAANSPFEVIEESGEVTVAVRRSKLLRTKVDIYRTAVVDDSICDVVQFTPREVSLIGKSQGSTHVTFWFDDPKMQPVTYLVRVAADAAETKKIEDNYAMLQDVINEMFPDSKIQLLVVADKLIIRGQAKDSEEAAQIVALVRSQSGGNANANVNGGFGGSLSEGAAAQVLSDSATGAAQRSRLQVINMLRVPGVQQVALRVKIAEMNRSAARGFGVDVKGHINFSENPNGSQMFLQSMLNVAAGSGPALLTQFDGDDIQVGIRYLQQHGVIRLLSEPTLVTMSGTPATFIAGGEFAVPTLVGSAGLNAVTTDFRAFGAIISFMPTVVDKDRIRLQVSPEFSQINSQLAVGGTPGLKVRAATTTVEMREGQTLAIAGLLEDNMNGTNTGDLPFLAKVFGRRDMSRNETELLILVTPELVQAMEPEEVPPLPGFDITEPTSAQFFLHGQLEGNPTQDYRSTVWPRLKKRYGAGGPAMTSGPFGHGQ